MRVEVDGRSKAIVVSFRVRQTDPHEPVGTTLHMPLSPPVLKISSRDRHALECIWTDPGLHGCEGVQYALEMCKMGAAKWDSYTNQQRRSLDSLRRKGKLPKMKHHWAEVWRGSDRATVVHAEFYGALVRVRRLFPHADTASEVWRHTYNFTHVLSLPSVHTFNYSFSIQQCLRSVHSPAIHMIIT